MSRMMLIFSALLFLVGVSARPSKNGQSRCSEPDTPKNANLFQICLDINCMVTYRCKDGYKNIGGETQVCQEGGVWSGRPVECKEILCPMLKVPAYGRILRYNRTYLAEATLICDKGYVVSRPDVTTRQCQQNETWSSGEGTCQAVHCDQLTDPKHGRIRQQEGTYLANVTVSCDEGYVYSEPNSTLRVCQGDNTWSGKQGICEGTPCPDLPEVSGGALNSRKGRFGDTVTLQCPSGHAVDGPFSVTCQANGEWSSQLGTCKTTTKDAVLIVILLLLFTGFVIGIGLFLFRKKYCNKANRRRGEEEVPLLGIKELHCSFKLTKDFTQEYQQRDSNEYQLFSSLMIHKIKDETRQRFQRAIEVTVTDLNQQQNTVFIGIQSTQALSQEALTSVLKDVTIETGTGHTYQINPGSIVYREKVKHILAADIRRKRHAPDKGLDKVIDLDTQYVRLKLLSNKSQGKRWRPPPERPDHYQLGLEKTGGREIQDEDLLQPHTGQKYVLIRGRAGIGKSTLMQQLLWKWANGNLAGDFQAIFMLNLRYLITIPVKMDLPRLLSLYAVYRTSPVIVDENWLTENEEHIGIILDGIDEIQNFKERWEANAESLSIGKPADPISWCLSIMKRQLLKHSTVIVSSRPFSALRFIEQHIGKELRLVELMGLTKRRVMEFVEKNVSDEEKQESIKDTLTKNPILLSVSAITFYCAALCKVLGKDDMAALQLSTYTRITAYILKAYMQRSLMDDSGTSEDVLCDSAKHTLHLLSRLALAGLLGEKSRELPRLVFEKKDFENLKITKEEVHEMRRAGLLMETEIQDPDDEKKSVTLSQFVHLSIQEFLAMAGLLREGNGKVNQTLTEISMTEQFNMTLLFLYGLFFDKDSVALNNMFGSTEDGSSLEMDLSNTLLRGVNGVTNDLQALQIAHESQSQEIAKKVGECMFKDKVEIQGTKLTVIDITAMVFVLKHYNSADTIILRHVGLDLSSVQEISNFLQDCDIIQKLELNDDALDDTCVKHLTQCLKQNNSLETLSITSEGVTDIAMEELVTAVKGRNKLLKLRLDFDAVTDQGMAKFAKALGDDSRLKDVALASDNMGDVTVPEIADALRKNTHLKKLSLTSDKITDVGIRHLSFSLKENKTLESLSILSGGLTNNGVQNISSALTVNDSLVDLWLHGFHMNDKGVDAILQLVGKKAGLAVRIWPPDCSDKLRQQVKNHPRISVD